MLRRDLVESPWLSRRWKHANNRPFLLALLALFGLGWTWTRLAMRDLSRPTDPCQKAVDRVEKGMDWEHRFCRVRSRTT